MQSNIVDFESMTYIQLIDFFKLRNPTEIYCNNYIKEINIKFQNIYLTHDNKIIGENRKHFYNKISKIEYKIDSDRCDIAHCSIDPSVIENDCELSYKLDSEKEQYEKQLNNIEIDIAVCSDILKILNQAHIYFENIVDKIIKNEINIYISKNKKWKIDFCFENLQFKIYPVKKPFYYDKKSNDKIFNQLKNLNNSDNSDNSDINKINIKLKKEDFGKHSNVFEKKYKNENNEYVFKHSNIVSSTVIKKQLICNKTLIDDVETLIDDGEYLKHCVYDKKFYDAIILNLKQNKYQQNYEKDNMLEIFCHNITIFKIIKIVSEYLSYLNFAKKNLMNNKWFAYTNKMMFSNKIYNYVVKLDDEQLKKRKWNIDKNNNIIFTECYLINSYDNIFIKDENRKIYFANGYVLCKAKTNKYNIFPVYDEDINYLKYEKINIDEDTEMYDFLTIL
jgi:hypothetical protein